MQDLSLPKERRKHPRYSIDLPLSFQMTESPNIYAGLITNVSEAGLQIQAMEDMSIGLKLSIEVFFAMGFELSALEGMAQVIWKNDYDDHAWNQVIEGMQEGNQQDAARFQHGVADDHAEAGALKHLHHQTEQRVVRIVLAHEHHRPVPGPPDRAQQ